MLHLRTLGAMDLAQPGEGALTAVLRQPKRFALLAYLACRHPSASATRDELLGLFWPDLDTAHARNALNRALHFLRRELPSGTLASLGRTRVGVGSDSVSCDALAFRERLESERDEEALSLYGGDFLPGLYVDGAASFHEWLERERSWYRWQAKAAGLRLVDSDLDRGRIGGALRWVAALNRVAVNDEEVVRATVKTHMRAGDRASAVAHLQRFETWLGDELGVGVPAELVRLLDPPSSQRSAEPLPASSDEGPPPELLEASRAAIKVETLDEHRAFIDQLPDMAYRCDLRGSFPFVNETTARVSGYSPEELTGMSFEQLVREDFRDRVVEFYLRQVDGRIPVTYLEFPAVARDGREFWVGQRVRLLERDGMPVGIEAVTRDITTRVRREKANRRAALEDRETRLLNREGFALVGRQRIRENRRNREPFFVLHVRAARDGAVAPNTSFAEATKTMRVIGGILRQTVREADAIGRIDEWELAVLAASGGREAAQAMQHRVETACSHAGGAGELADVRIHCESVVHDATRLSSADALMTFGWVGTR